MHPQAKQYTSGLLGANASRSSGDARVLDQLDTVYVEANNTVGTAARARVLLEADTVDGDAGVQQRMWHWPCRKPGGQCCRVPTGAPCLRRGRAAGRTTRAAVPAGAGAGATAGAAHGPQVGVGDRQEVQLVLELAIAFAQPFDFGLGIERSLLPVHFRLCGHELGSWERCAAELI